MSQLERFENQEQAPSLRRLIGLEGCEQDPLWQATAVAVSIMFDTLRTYGRSAEGIADSWYLVLKRRKVTVQELAEACEEFATGGQGYDFPEPGRVCDWIAARRTDHAQQEAIRAGIRSDDERSDALRREMNLRIYGSENPSIEQIRERNLREPVQVIDKGLRPMPEFRHPTPEELAETRARLEAQKERLREANGQ